MEQSSFRETNCRSASQEIPRLHFITVFVRVRHWYIWDRLIQSIHLNAISFRSNLILSFLVSLDLNRGLFLFRFFPVFHLPPWEINASPMSSYKRILTFNVSDFPNVFLCTLQLPKDLTAVPFILLRSPAYR